MSYNGVSLHGTTLTFCVIFNLYSKFSPGGNSRIEASAVAGQRRARVHKSRLCDGMWGPTEEDQVGASHQEGEKGTYDGKRNVTKVPFAATTLEGENTSPPWPTFT